MQEGFQADSFVLSNKIIEDNILEKVAHTAWSKELLKKFQKTYMSKYTSGTSLMMYHLKSDDRHDDEAVTPKTKISKLVPSKSTDKIISIQKNVNNQEQLKGLKFNSSQRFDNITKFNYYKKNIETIVPQREYEHNEPPPPGYDNFMVEQQKYNGQFLLKNQTYAQGQDLSSTKLNQKELSASQKSEYSKKKQISYKETRNDNSSSEYIALKTKKTGSKNTRQKEQDQNELNQDLQLRQNQPEKLIADKSQLDIINEQLKNINLNQDQRQNLLKQKEEEMSLIQNVEIYRKRKIEKDELERKRLLQKQKKKGNQIDQNLENQLGIDGVQAQINYANSSLNVQKLPQIQQADMKAIVGQSHISVNTRQDQKNQKKKGLLQFQDAYQDERPGSARSGATGITGGMTAAYTQMTGNQTVLSKNNEIAKQQEQILQQANEGNLRLIELLKFDTTIGREQNIDLGKESSLANYDNMIIRGGVKLTQFAPQKKRKSYAQDTESEVSENFTNKQKEAQQKDKKIDFEEKIKKREKAEADGKIEPRQVAHVLEGGKYNNYGRLTRKEYMSKVINHGSLVHIQQNKLHLSQSKDQILNSKKSQRQKQVLLLNQEQSHSPLSVEDQMNKSNIKKSLNDNQYSKSQQDFKNLNRENRIKEGTSPANAYGFQGKFFASRNKTSNSPRFIHENQNNFQYGGPTSRGGNRPIDHQQRLQVIRKMRSKFGQESDTKKEKEQEIHQKSGNENESDLFYLEKNKIQFHLNLNYSTKQLITGVKLNQNQTTNAFLPSMMKTGFKDQKTSEVDLFRSTLNTSHGVTVTDSNRKQYLQNMRNSNSSRVQFRNDQDYGIQKNKSSVQLSQVNIGASSTIKAFDNMNRPSQIYNYFSTSKQKNKNENETQKITANQNFNLKLLGNLNPKTVQEELNMHRSFTNNKMSSLSLQAKKNLQHKDHIKNLVIGNRLKNSSVIGNKLTSRS